MKVKSLLLVFLSLLLLVAFTDCSGKKGSEKQKETYYCPMHPNVIADKPGSCPICQMDLVKKVEGDAISSKDLDAILSLDKNATILANVNTAKATKEKIYNDIKIFGNFDFAENSRKTISAKFAGRIEKLFVDKTGDYVSAGTPLFEAYSPDLVRAQSDYLNLVKSNGLSADAKQKSIAAARARLTLAGLTANQIQTLESGNEPIMTITYYASQSGMVIEKNVQEGVYFQEGTSLYRLADLSTLWGVMEVYQEEIKNISIGEQVEAFVNAYPDEKFFGTVSFIYPVLNAEAGTVKVRVLFSNPNAKLKPAMYFTGVIRKDLGEGIIVPETALLRTGSRDIVWVKTGEGMFTLREVKVGSKFAGKYPILSGINAGDEIAVSGGFLIDSESRLKNKGEAKESKHNDKVSENKKTESKPEMHNHSAEQHSAPKEEKSTTGAIDLQALDVNKDGKIWQCPMDFNILSDTKIRCSVCKMWLEEVSLKEAKENLVDANFTVK